MIPSLNAYGQKKQSGGIRRIRKAGFPPGRRESQVGLRKTP